MSALNDYTPERCMALDRANITNDFQRQRKAEVKSRLISEILAIRPETKHLEKQGIYYLRCVLERVTIDYAKEMNERMHANAHTAHQQLKNFYGG